MPYERVEFSINTPIIEPIGEIPDDIKLIKENGATTGLWVIIGEEKTEKIKSSKHFTEILAESEKQHKITDPQEKSKNFINQLEEEIRNHATQKAKTFINQLNFRLNSPTYRVQLTALVILMYQRHLRYGASAYVKSDYVTDIYEINDGDNLLNRMTHNYNNGLEAQQNQDLVGAYKSFYLVFPEKHEITTDSKLNLDLRLLRDGASHNVLNSPALVTRAKELLGEDFVKVDTHAKPYAYIDMTNQRHIKLFNKHVPILRERAHGYIDSYIQLHT
jgi:hypothetical protein